MGYITSFNMKILNEENHEVDSALYSVFEDDKFYDGLFSIRDLIEGDAESCKWYDHKDELIIYSKKFPNLVFILDGRGEEAWSMLFLMKLQSVLNAGRKVL